jgi:hypothetical protein
MAEKKSHTLLYAGLAAAAVLGFAWWRSQQSGTASTAPGAVGPSTTATPQGTNITGITISNGIASPSYMGPQTNMQWGILADDGQVVYTSPMLPSIQAIEMPTNLKPGTYALSMTPYVSVSGAWQPAGSIYGGSNSVQFTV